MFDKISGLISKQATVGLRRDCGPISFFYFFLIKKVTKTHSKLMLTNEIFQDIIRRL